MAVDDDKTCTIACSVEVPSGEVDAGAEMTLSGRVVCSPAGDLRGHTLQIIDHAGALAASPELIEVTGVANETGPFTVEAPLEPGDYTWLAVCPAFTGGGLSGEETSVPFSFTVRPHDTSVVVWDVPPAIECGETFSVQLGIKCSSECRPDGWLIEVHDQEGRSLASATVGGEPIPGTAALYCAEVELKAPDTEGLHDWEAKASVDGPADETEDGHVVGPKIRHAQSTAPFRVRVVPPPECLLTVVAVDAEAGSPVEGVKVVVHPYEAFTDERGIAEVRLPKGEYRLFVSGRQYFPFRSDGAMEEDVTIKAELVVDRELSDADIWS